MAIRLAGTLEPANGKDPVAHAKDIAMPDGSRLSAFNPVYPVESGKTTMEPETYYQFGEVEDLAVTLSDKGDGKAHEYVFEFIPAEGFSELTISPDVLWLVEPQYPAGKRCLVSICMGMAVMACG